MSKYKGFSSVQLNKPKRSYFDMSHQKRLSTRMGRLTPVFIKEAIPGDNWHNSSEILLRVAPLLAPIYDQIQLFVHFFFVPNRLLWEEWETFITGGRLGVGIDPATAPIPPRFSVGANTTGLGFDIVGKSSLSDYLGVPILEELDPVLANWDNVFLDLMPYMAYTCVWYEYYRDRNFEPDYGGGSGVGTLPAESGTLANPTYFVTLRTRAYLHDYFTSALPSPQRGIEVLMPVDNTLSGYAPVVSHSDGSIDRWNLDGTVTPGGGSITKVLGEDGDAPEPVGVNDPDMWANLGAVQNSQPGIAASINDFRSAYALQVWLERNEIAGSRYVESNLAHFGIKSQDSRLQRPEYLGGGRIPVKISEVVSTAYSDDGTGVVPLANMAGHGVTYGNTNSFKYFCPEHGFIIGIASIMNPPSYHQGLPRMFKRGSFLDYPWPTFAKLGEQEVHAYELYASPENLTLEEGEYPLFGYQSRYADWKHEANTNHGDFHDTLLFWTLTREFESSPVLGTSFNYFEDSTQDRIFAVNGAGDNFWLYVHNKCGVTRALPYFGQPNTLGFV